MLLQICLVAAGLSFLVIFLHGAALWMFNWWLVPGTYLIAVFLIYVVAFWTIVAEASKQEGPF